MITIKLEVEKMLKKKIIEECTKVRGQFISSYFLVKKADGTNRFIFNLKKLNKFIDTIHFKMEDIRSAKNLLTQDAYMGSLDLKDAYYLIPVQENHRKFLRFKFSDKLYQFTCLPFGLSTSPYVFTKLMKPVVNHLRQRGIISMIYLDDILFIHESKETCTNNIKYAIKLLERLGFVINYQKSSLMPSQECNYLGFKINSHKFCIELTEEKKV